MNSSSYFPEVFGHIPLHVCKLRYYSFVENTLIFERVAIGFLDLHPSTSIIAETLAPTAIVIKLITSNH